MVNDSKFECHLSLEVCASALLIGFILQTNTFQGLIVTNGPTSYAVFTYKCGLLEWSGDAVIGFRSEQDHLSIHPLSGSSAQLIACENSSVSNWTNVIYRLDLKREGLFCSSYRFQIGMIE